MQLTSTRFHLQFELGVLLQVPVQLVQPGGSSVTRWFITQVIQLNLLSREDVFKQLDQVMSEVDECRMAGLCRWLDHQRLLLENTAGRVRVDSALSSSVRENDVEVYLALRVFW